jgi:hypothetical protein
MLGYKARRNTRAGRALYPVDFHLLLLVVPPESIESERRECRSQPWCCCVSRPIPCWRSITGPERGDDAWSCRTEVLIFCAVLPGVRDSLVRGCKIGWRCGGTWGSLAGNRRQAWDRGRRLATMWRLHCTVLNDESHMDAHPRMEVERNLTNSLEI